MAWKSTRYYGPGNMRNPIAKAVRLVTKPKVIPNKKKLTRQQFKKGM